MANPSVFNRPRNVGTTDAYSKGEFIAACIRTYGFISGAYLDAEEQSRESPLLPEPRSASRPPAPLHHYKRLKMAIKKGTRKTDTERQS